MPFYILKIGGSLIRYAKEIMHQLHLLTAEGYRFLIIPGGGPMADLVRDLFNNYKISQEAAHWMAILAMEQYAYFLADMRDAKLVNEISIPKSGINVLRPYPALLKNDIGIIHNWDYTSDSVAALAACRLDTNFVKVTDVDGIVLNGNIVREISAMELIGKDTCIDQGTLRLLNRCGQNCLVLNGTDPKKFVACLKKERVGTLIRA